MKVIVDNLATEYLDEGTGPTLVLLHGWADTLHTFDALVKQLADFRIIRIDLPGFGGSERPRESWDVGRYAQFVQDVLKKLDVHSYVLAGHSFGGRVILKGVGTDVLVPEKIILIASAGVSKIRTTRNEALKVVAKVGKSLTLVPPISRYRQNIRKRLYGAIGSDYFASGSMSDIYVKAIGEDLLECAKNIHIPALLLWGKDDTSTPLADGMKIHQAIEDSKLEILGGSHFIHQEKPQEVALLIKEFV